MERIKKYYIKNTIKKCFRLELIIMTSKIPTRHFSHFLVTISTHLFLIGGSKRGLLLLTHDCTYKRRQIISFLGEVGQIWTFNCIPKQEKRIKRINNQPSLVFVCCWTLDDDTVFFKDMVGNQSWIFGFIFGVKSKILISFVVKLHQVFRGIGCLEMLLN